MSYKILHAGYSFIQLAVNVESFITLSIRIDKITLLLVMET